MSVIDTIIRALHAKPIRKNARNVWTARCPVHDDHNPSLSLRLNDGRLLWHCHRGCSQAAVGDALRRLGYEEPRREQPPQEAPRQPSWSEQEDEAKRTASARLVWNNARDPRGTLAETYLGLRGLSLDADLCRVLRFHPSCRYDDDVRLPCLIAAFTPIIHHADGLPCAILRVFLKPDGSKHDRKMLGPVRDAAIKLDAGETVTSGLGIGEGLETCMSVRARGWHPVWALGAAGPIERFPVLDGIESLTIFADHDESNVGEKKAQACAARWRAAGREARILMPEEPGYDWNDVDRVCA